MKPEGEEGRSSARAAAPADSRARRGRRSSPRSRRTSPAGRAAVAEVEASSRRRAGRRAGRAPGNLRATPRRRHSSLPAKTRTRRPRRTRRPPTCAQVYPAVQPLCGERSAALGRRGVAPRVDQAPSTGGRRRPSQGPRDSFRGRFRPRLAAVPSVGTKGDGDACDAGHAGEHGARRDHAWWPLWWVLWLGVIVAIVWFVARRRRPSDPTGRTGRGDIPRGAVRPRGAHGRRVPPAARRALGPPLFPPLDGRPRALPQAGLSAGRVRSSARSRRSGSPRRPRRVRSAGRSPAGTCRPRRAP